MNFPVYLKRTDNDQAWLIDADTVTAGPKLVSGAVKYSQYCPLIDWQVTSGWKIFLWDYHFKRFNRKCFACTVGFQEGGLLWIQATRPSAKLWWLILFHHAYAHLSLCSTPALSVSVYSFPSLAAIVFISLTHILDINTQLKTHIYGLTLLPLHSQRQKARTWHSSLPPIRVLILNISPV